MTNPNKQGPRKRRESQTGLVVESELKMPKEILPWEHDLLTTVLSALKEIHTADSRLPEVPQ